MHESIPTAEAPGAACGVVVHALVEATLAEIPAMRDRPSPPTAPALPARFLRHADEQTVVGLRAVLAAIAALPEPRPSFTEYGVVAAPCQAGRIATAQSLAQLRTAGGVAVSPHIVPQCSLHSLAGAVSVAFGMHGPNVGASGGRHAVSEGLFTSLSLFAAEADLPGIWLVVSGWTEEPPLDAGGRPLPVADDCKGPICRALAVALSAEGHATAEAEPRHRLSLHMTAGRMLHPLARDQHAADEILSFARALDGMADTGWSHAGPRHSGSWRSESWASESWGWEFRLASLASAAGGSSRREAA